MYKSDIKEIRTIQDYYDDSNVNRSADRKDNSTLKKSAKATDPKKNLKFATAKTYKKGPIKVTLNPQKKRLLQKQLYKCEESLEKLKARGPRNYTTGEDIRRGPSVAVSKKYYKRDITYHEAVWEKKVRQLEGKCSRIKKRLQGYIVAEPRIDSPGR
jgi:hypothetical protein